MTRIATVVSEGGGQVVKLPNGIHLEPGEVLATQVGRSVVLVPKGGNSWQPLIESLGQFSEDFLADRCQPEEQKRDSAFE